MVSVVIHTNTQLFNQRETGSWIKAGFARHGIAAEITADKHKAADVHVVQGPWYCLNYWQPRADQHRVLFLNRCFYGDARFDVSLGWLRCDGSRDYRNDSTAVHKGTLPRLKKRKDARRSAVVFSDWGQDCTERVREARQRFDAVYFRPHPAEPQRTTPVMTLPGSLDAIWGLCDVAIGHSSTVLVEALINGLHVESSDPQHVVHDCDDREAWLKRLSWAQWHADELQRGDFWDHLCTE